MLVQGAGHESFGALVPFSHDIIVEEEHTFINLTQNESPLCVGDTRVLGDPRGSGVLVPAAVEPRHAPLEVACGQPVEESLGCLGVGHFDLLAL